jgi:hypothetical protein
MGADMARCGKMVLEYLLAVDQLQALLVGEGFHPVSVISMNASS